MIFVVCNGHRNYMGPPSLVTAQIVRALERAGQCELAIDQLPVLRRGKKQDQLTPRTQNRKRPGVFDQQA
jgi:hypothetical protein